MYIKKSQRKEKNTIPTNLTLMYYSDIHCHPLLQAFGQSRAIKQPNKKADLWYDNPPKFMAKIWEKLFGVSAYSQCNLNTFGNGNGRIIGISVHSPEKSFFQNKLGDTNFNEDVSSLITMYGKDRIEELKSSNYNYFTDCIEQLDFLWKYQGSSNGKKQFFIATNANELQTYLQNPNAIIGIINMEGGHMFDCGNPPIKRLNIEQSQKVLDHLAVLKLNAKYRPIYMTVAHHYYNQLAGHCRSLPGTVNFLANQGIGINSGISELGYKVIRKLLSKEDGERIIPDIKHFSVLARKQYYDLLDSEYAHEHVPIIFSHGGVTGLNSFTDPGSYSADSPFNTWDINLYDDEIIRISRSKGIMGMNIDQRVMGSTHALYEVKISIKYDKKNIAFYWSKLIFNNIKHIAITLDKAGLNAWDCICMGTDYDGVINPVDCFHTAHDMPKFAKELEKHIIQFNDNYTFLQSSNMINPSKAVSMIMHENLESFLKRNMV